jgi:hypothetical protein
VAQASDKVVHYKDNFNKVMEDGYVNPDGEFAYLNGKFQEDVSSLKDAIAQDETLTPGAKGGMIIDLENLLSDAKSEVANVISGESGQRADYGLFYAQRDHPQASVRLYVAKLTDKPGVTAFDENNVVAQYKFEDFKQADVSKSIEAIRNYATPVLSTEIDGVIGLVADEKAKDMLANQLRGNIIQAYVIADINTMHKETPVDTTEADAAKAELEAKTEAAKKALGELSKEAGVVGNIKAE